MLACSETREDQQEPLRLMSTPRLPQVRKGRIAFTPWSGQSALLRCETLREAPLFLRVRIKQAASGLSILIPGRTWLSFATLRETGLFRSQIPQSSQGLKVFVAELFAFRPRRTLIISDAAGLL